MSLMMLGWMPSVGSVQDEQPGLRRQRAGNGELLLLPAREIAAAAVDHLLEHREQFVQLRRNRRAAALVGQAHAQVFLDREAREDLAALRHEADAGPGAVVGRGLLDRLAFELDAAALDGHQAHQRLQQRGLAHAIAAQQHGDLAEPGLKAHVPAGCGSRRSTGGCS
jgi:hypothetical protein